MEESLKDIGLAAEGGGGLGGTEVARTYLSLSQKAATAGAPGFDRWGLWGEPQAETPRHSLALRAGHDFL